MIKLNNVLIKQETFGDGTLKCATPSFMRWEDEDCSFEILWCYDSDSELFTLITLRDFLRENFPNSKVWLTMPYIPHARQDRYVSGRLFTLKSFAKVINSLDFYRVAVWDPHSDVSKALIDRIQVEPFQFVPTDIHSVMMYPDNGAAKKYGEYYGDTNPIIGNKHRNKEGRIDSYELLNFVDGTKSVTIRDDICSYGGTFLAAAKALREHGVEHIELIVTHCENNILKGDVLNYVDKVITTDSIFTEKHPKIEVVTHFREINKEDK